jgi:SAM-dependent methyltransferase
LKQGPYAREWAVRARSFDAFVRGVLTPLARRLGPPLRVLDLGAGNGWLCHRMASMGHTAVALDVRTDRIDGLGAAAAYAPYMARLFARVAGAFERLPFDGRVFDVAVFNASLHYARDVGHVVREAARVVRGGGRLAVLDSPFYRDAASGEAMAREKRAGASQVFGELAAALSAPRFVEYLTPERLSVAVRGLEWQHIRVRYPLWYEARPWVARVRRRREPSRFDVWWAEVR